MPETHVSDMQRYLEDRVRVLSRIVDELQEMLSNHHCVCCLRKQDLNALEALLEVRRHSRGNANSNY